MVSRDPFGQSGRLNIAQWPRFGPEVGLGHVFRADMVAFDEDWCCPIQGDEVDHTANLPLELDYHFLGDRGFSSIEAFDASGVIWKRHFWSESDNTPTILRITWGGARLYDRCREAIWDGTIETTDESASITNIKPFGGLEYNPENQAVQKDSQTISFHSHTSGGLDGVHISFQPESSKPSHITVEGTMCLDPLHKEWKGRYIHSNELDYWYDQHTKPDPKVTIEARIKKLRPDLAATYQGLIRSIMSKVIVFRPEERLTATQLLHDPSFGELMERYCC